MAVLCGNCHDKQAGCTVLYQFHFKTPAPCERCGSRGYTLSVVHIDCHRADFNKRKRRKEAY